MIKVSPRAQLHADRAGEPLDGLVNMFDIGIILAVGFLIAALQKLDLTEVLTHKVKVTPHISLKPNEKVEKIKPGERRVEVKNGAPVGEVYELPNGQLVYVRKTTSGETETSTTESGEVESTAGGTGEATTEESGEAETTTGK